MFYCMIYRPVGNVRKLGNSDWNGLRKAVAEVLRKHRDAKWGALHDDEGMYVGRARRSMASYPKEKPTEYMPDKDLFTRPREP
jgi:hypothetical protein